MKNLKTWKWLKNMSVKKFLKRPQFFVGIGDQEILKLNFIKMFYKKQRIFYKKRMKNIFVREKKKEKYFLREKKEKHF